MTTSWAPFRVHWGEHILPGIGGKIKAMWSHHQHFWPDWLCRGGGLADLRSWYSVLGSGCSSFERGPGLPRNLSSCSWQKQNKTKQNTQVYFHLKMIHK